MLVLNSCNKEVFLEAVPDYQKELERCGYQYKLAYNPPVQPATKPGRRRGGRRVTWFNPPYSLDVATNVAREFLQLIDKHFPPSHPLHSICNISTIKVSYRCLPNMGSVIARHNSKVLKNSDATQPQPVANCNCRKKQDCPVPGMCNQNGVVYQATVNSAGGRQELYVGLAKNFKKRYPGHKKNLLDEHAVGPTTLSKYFWAEKNAGRDPKVTWRYVEKNVPVYNPISNKCRLCLREKFNIVLRPNMATLNSRQEIFAHCRHLLPELISGAPD